LKKTPEEVAALAQTQFGFRFMKWLDIPTDRVLEVERNELMNEFDMYDKAGELCSGGRAYLLFRKKDGRRFKFAQFGDLDGAVTRKCVYLEEI
jgi:hypothetical protein